MSLEIVIALASKHRVSALNIMLCDGDTKMYLSHHFTITMVLCHELSFCFAETWSRSKRRFFLKHRQSVSDLITLEFILSEVTYQLCT